MAHTFGRAKVEPIRLDVRRKVEPAGVFDFECENEELFACWAAEQVQAEGTTIDYWSQDLVRTKLDPLYNEPERREWLGPYRFKAWVEMPQQAFESKEEGARILYSGNIWIPRLMVEESEMEEVPKEGDVLRIWPIPHFDSFAQGVDHDIPNAGYYFDVLESQEDGHPLDNPHFDGFKMTVKRRSEFTPERRVLNQT
jgi:hypothetical protein